MPIVPSCPHISYPNITEHLPFLVLLTGADSHELHVRQFSVCVCLG